MLLMDGGPQSALVFFFFTRMKWRHCLCHDLVFKGDVIIPSTGTHWVPGEREVQGATWVDVVGLTAIRLSS